MHASAGIGMQVMKTLLGARWGVHGFGGADLVGGEGQVGLGRLPIVCKSPSPLPIARGTISGCQDETLLSLTRLGRVHPDTGYGVTWAGRASKLACVERIGCVICSQFRVSASAVAFPSHLSQVEVAAPLWLCEISHLNFAGELSIHI